jgi:HEAT repeat protein
LGVVEAMSALEVLLDDAVADVRWNAALSLSRLGSDAGASVLLEMVDRRLIEQVPEITPAQAEEVMVEAIVALGVTGADEARPILENLAESDASLKVRQAAIEALKALS